MGRSLPDNELIKKADELLNSGKPIAIATIIRKEGSGPRDVGAKIIVTQEGEVYGTLGGGFFEQHVVSEAVKAIKEGKPKTLKYSFTGKEVEGAINTGLICGGVVEVFIDVLKPVPKVAVFGVGRVGGPLARIAKFTGFNVIIADTNEEVISEDLRKIASHVIVGNPKYIGGELSKHLTEHDYAVITYGEINADYTVLKELINSNVGYVGLLGSRRKVTEFIKKLIAEGVPEEKILKKLSAPTGIDIGAETPEEISVSIIAEIIAKFRGHEAPGRLSIVRTVLENLKQGK